eukprot:6190923-Pleurochrysis_carterae.AAC.4
MGRTRRCGGPRDHGESSWRSPSGSSCCAARHKAKAESRGDLKGRRGLCVEAPRVCGCVEGKGGGGRRRTATWGGVREWEGMQLEKSRGGAGMQIGTCVKSWGGATECENDAEQQQRQKALRL